MNKTTIEYFHDKLSQKNLTDWERQFLSKAIYALNKRQPALVNNHKTFWHYYHYCPSCGSDLTIEGVKYCSRCGQCLDWSNYHEGLQNDKRTYRRAKKRTD